MPASCTRRIEFDAAHRVQGHEGKCRNLHGHRYSIEATFSATQLDNLGRVVDFGVIKTLLGQWIDDNWDHTTILFEQDATLGKAISGETGQAIFYLPTNPTAENMAEYLLHTVCAQLFAQLPIRCTRIRLYETPNCYAEASL
ncbi:MAG: 6-carboxytetrahydropterin synthase [Proteobacteria bacterium]|nr:6-carboxytetrahydropterin synthase [Pseudomonadota bacterium]